MRLLALATVILFLRLLQRDTRKSCVCCWILGLKLKRPMGTHAQLFTMLQQGVMKLWYVCCSTEGQPPAGYTTVPTRPEISNPRCIVLSRAEMSRWFEC